MKTPLNSIRKAPPTAVIWFIQWTVFILVSCSILLDAYSYHVISKVVFFAGILEAVAALVAYFICLFKNPELLRMTSIREVIRQWQDAISKP